MADSPLDGLRTEIQALATDDGRYRVHCARTGARAIPVDGLAFQTRPIAERAARLAERYRARLRQYDPDVDHVDLVACEAPVSARRPLDHGRSGRFLGDEFAAGSSARVQFCHRVLEATYRALRAGGHAAAEHSLMGAYADVADEVADADELCLLLLDRAARALDEHLAPEDRAAVCRAAADRLPSDPPWRPYPLVASFERLASADIVAAFDVAPWTVDEVSGHRSCTVRLRDYALWPADGRLATLPIALDVLRRLPDHGLTVGPARRFGDRAWELTVVAAPDRSVDGLARVPVVE